MAYHEGFTAALDDDVMADMPVGPVFRLVSGGSALPQGAEHPLLQTVVQAQVASNRRPARVVRRVMLTEKSVPSDESEAESSNISIRSA
jgi:hypothetical protein